jgi:hypothetical protein
MFNVASGPVYSSTATACLKVVVSFQDMIGYQTEHMAPVDPPCVNVASNAKRKRSQVIGCDADSVDDLFKLLQRVVGNNKNR